MIVAQLNIPYTLASALAVGAGVESDVIAVPARATTMTWEVIYGTAPGSVTMQLKGSLDNTNFVTIDTTTVVGGDLKTVNCNLGFIKVRQNAVTGGATFTVIITFKVL